LLEGTLIQRYKRFFADVRLAGTGGVVTAHVANTGSMKTCGAPGDTVYLLPTPDPKRKLAYNWELTRIGDGLVGVNTARPNHVVAAAVRAGRIEELKDATFVRQEAKYGANSRIDLLLEERRGNKQVNVYVEVKNATLLAADGSVAFPDAVTSRGLKHLEELSTMVAAGHRAVMLFFVNRTDGLHVRAAHEIDPAYAAGLKRAHAAGVEILAYRAEHTLEALALGARVPVVV